MAKVNWWLGKTAFPFGKMKFSEAILILLGYTVCKSPIKIIRNRQMGFLTNERKEGKSKELPGWPTRGRFALQSWQNPTCFQRILPSKVGNLKKPYWSENRSKSLQHVWKKNQKQKQPNTNNKTSNNQKKCQTKCHSIRFRDLFLNSFPVFCWTIMACWGCSFFPNPNNSTTQQHLISTSRFRCGDEKGGRAGKHFESTKGPIWSNGKTPRGPFHGCLG